MFNFLSARLARNRASAQRGATRGSASHFADPEMQVNFMKNVAMAGGLTFVAIFGGGAYTLSRARQNFKLRS